MDDVEQLLHAMTTGVAIQDGLSTVLRELPCRVLVLEHHLQVLRHVGAIFGHQKVPARREQPLDVGPWGGYQRNSTCQGLEYPDGGNARQRLHIGAPGNVHGDAMAGVLPRK